MSTTDLTELVQAAQNGIPQAQSKLMDFFWADVKNYISSLTKNNNQAEELTVETFTKAISKLHLYNVDFDFKTWLISIAHNSTIDFLRKNNALKEETLNITDVANNNLEPSPEEFLISKQNYQALTDAINSLDSKYQEVLQLRFFDDKSIEDISLELNVSIANVKVRIMRGRKLLQSILTTE